MTKYKDFKKFFLYILIGSLVIAAGVAVVTVLIGEFNEVLSRSLWTLGTAVIHSLVSLGLLWDNDRQHTFENFSFFINILFFIIGLSFITSIFGIWKMFPIETILRLYQSYAVIVATAFHGDALSKALNKEKYMGMIAYANYIFVIIVGLMLQPIIFIDNATKVLGDMYFRILGASAIIDGTLSVLLIIFYKLYMSKQPKIQENPMDPAVENKKPAGKISIWVWLLIIYLIILVLRWVF